MTRDILGGIIVTNSQPTSIVKSQSHPKAASRCATQNKMCRLEQVEVVAHVVHHIPDQDHSHVIDLDFCDVDGEDDLKTVLPWKKYPLVSSDGFRVPAQVSLVQYGTSTCLKTGVCRYFRGLLSSLSQV